VGNSFDHLIGARRQTSNPVGVRVLRLARSTQHFTYLTEPKGFSEATLDSVAKALNRFKAYTKFRDFEAFHIEQDVPIFARTSSDLRRKFPESFLRSKPRLRRSRMIHSFSEDAFEYGLSADSTSCRSRSLQQFVPPRQRRRKTIQWH
jgi:hypothetical protein